MKALLNGKVLAEAAKDVLLYIEGHVYFPKESVNLDLLKESVSPVSTFWLGERTYYDVGVGDELEKDYAHTHLVSVGYAVDTVKKDYAGYVAFPYAQLAELDS